MICVNAHSGNRSGYGMPWWLPLVCFPGSAWNRAPRKFGCGLGRRLRRALNDEARWTVRVRKQVLSAERTYITKATMRLALPQ